MALTYEGAKAMINLSEPHSPSLYKYTQAIHKQHIRKCDMNELAFRLTININRIIGFMISPFNIDSVIEVTRHVSQIFQVMV